jgi:ferric-dicitrate binding protein FerR (iron transport regulator)
MEDRYTSYSPLQIAGEEPFIRWVLHAEKDEQWNLWLQEYPALQNSIAEARYIVLTLSNATTDTLPPREKASLWNRIHTSVLSEKQETKQRSLSPLWKWASAAAATLALVIWFNSLMYSDHAFAGAGEQTEFILPEESVVTLNAGSYIQYKDKTFDKKRELFLDGEAFFLVTPGSTFTIKTDNGRITVLGTSFNVVSREGRLEVSCYTGKVKVQTHKDDVVTITAGERVKATKTEPALKRSAFIPSGNKPEWTIGKFMFEDQRLSEVFAEFERQFNVKVRLDPGLGDLKYTGLFESGDIEKALSLITWPLHLKAHVEGKTITISR